MRARRAIALAAAFCLPAGVCAGQAAEPETVRQVHFPPGQSSATIHGALVRGEANIYVVAAKGGQNAEIGVTSLEENADLMIYQPPSQLKRGPDGVDVTGPVLPGGDKVEGLDQGATRHWRGALPASGFYYIVVSGDRGNVTYDLSVAID